MSNKKYADPMFVLNNIVDDLGKIIIYNNKYFFYHIFSKIFNLFFFIMIIIHNGIVY